MYYVKGWPDGENCYLGVAQPRGQRLGQLIDMLILFTIIRVYTKNSTKELKLFFLWDTDHLSWVRLLF